MFTAGLMMKLRETPIPNIPSVIFLILNSVLSALLVFLANDPGFKRWILLIALDLL